MATSTDPWDIPGAPKGGAPGKVPSDRRGLLLRVVFGIIAGGFLGALAGYADGLLLITWDADPDCCGLEAVGAVGIGFLAGGATGAISGGLVAARRWRGRRIAFHLLAVLIALGHLTNLIVSMSFEFDYEDILSAYIFVGLGLCLPMLVWALLPTPAITGGPET